MSPEIISATNSGHIPRRSVNDESLPLVVHHQEPAVRLREVLHTELDEGLVGDRHLTDQKLQDAILTPLREHLEAVVRQDGKSFPPIGLSHRPALQDGDRVEALLKVKKPLHAVAKPAQNTVEQDDTSAV